MIPFRGAGARAFGAVQRLAVAAACVLLARNVSAADAAPASDPPGALSRVFWYGPSAGTPSTGKTVTVFTFYALGAAGAAFGGVYLGETLQARAKTDRFIRSAGSVPPCYDRASTQCGELVRLRSDENQASHLALLGAAGAGAFLLTGLVSALVWDNTLPNLALRAAPLTASHAPGSPLLGAELVLQARF